MKKLTTAAALLALLAAACGSETRYGPGGGFDNANGSEGAIRSSSTVPPETTAPPAAAPSNTPTTAKPATTTTAKPAAQGYPIKIQADQAGTQFEPRVAQVFAGTPVTWTNTDSVARSVEFSDQSFVSGPIAPGASVTFTANRAGEFNYSDGTRPYAVGTLRVQGR
ncbi:MAG TPA: cupredoxin domain-containing protein [Acidimicrobiales bacterium]|nr:cupredoxin domain-containing protein [Acidimicrobiales bacterium]